MNNKTIPVSLAMVAGAISTASAQTSTNEAGQPIPKVVITGVGEGEQIERSGDSDTTSLLRGTPGYAVAQAGGVSGLPMVNGATTASRSASTAWKSRPPALTT